MRGTWFWGFLLNCVLVVIIVALSLTFLYGQEPTDPVLKSLAQQKAVINNEYERVQKQLQLLERLDAAEKAYREVIQQEQARRETLLKADMEKEKGKKE